MCKNDTTRITIKFSDCYNINIKTTWGLNNGLVKIAQAWCAASQVNRIILGKRWPKHLTTLIHPHLCVWKKMAAIISWDDASGTILPVMPHDYLFEVCNTSCIATPSIHFHISYSKISAISLHNCYGKYKLLLASWIMWSTLYEEPVYLHKAMHYHVISRGCLQCTIRFEILEVVIVRNFCRKQSRSSAVTKIVPWARDICLCTQCSIQNFEQVN